MNADDTYELLRWIIKNPWAIEQSRGNQMSDLLFENMGWEQDVADVPTLPSRIPTQPDIEPATLPQIPLKRSASSCYFCDKQAHDDVNGIPMCEECQHRYGRDK